MRIACIHGEMSEESQVKGIKVILEAFHTRAICLYEASFLALKSQISIQMVYLAPTALRSFDMPGMARKLH